MVVVNVKAKTERQKSLSDSTSDCEVLLAGDLQEAFRQNCKYNSSVTYTISDVYEISKISACNEEFMPWLRQLDSMRKELT
jgi:hypothetical protein